MGGSVSGFCLNGGRKEGVSPSLGNIRDIASCLTLKMEKKHLWPRKLVPGKPGPGSIGLEIFKRKIENSGKKGRI